jgi:hypothetical protein
MFELHLVSVSDFSFFRVVLTEYISVAALGEIQRR